ncbi:cyclophilin-like fold protein [Rhodococcus opacus]|uniref:cyclophilin-like fold protein n=1 Tax=Rhodococcus opacus TaxID=37919 RepID=UPI00211DB7DC|nr:cyclophilin-like fold protein [Rhodococcus opacus]
MRSKPLTLAFAFTFAATLPLLLTACSTSTTDDGTGAPSPSTAPTSSSTPGASHDAVGTTVRFTAGDTSIHVTMEDNPAARDFLSMLPLTLEFEDFAGNEKISYLPREVDDEETEGSILNQGDFLYYIPWGNVGFWYSFDPSTHAEDSLVLGSFEASLDELEYLEGRDVTVEVLP